MAIDITQILVLFIEILASIVSVFVVRYLRSKLSSEQMELLSAAVNTAVYGAEQIFKGTGLGQKKKEYVVNYLRENGYDVDTEAVNAAIEAAVIKMKNELNPEVL